MNRRIFITIIAAAAVAVGAVYLNRSRQSPTVATLKVGANLAMTGKMPYWSSQISRGLRIAVDEANAKTPNRPIELKIEDNQGEPKNAIAAFQKLATVDKVSSIITTHTFIAKPQQPLALQHKIPLLGTVVSAVSFGDENQWSFLDWPSQQDLTPPVATYCLQKLGAKTAVVLVVNDDYGMDGAKIFVQHFVAGGGKITGEETFANADTDLRPQITKLLAGSPDIIYTVGREGSLVTVVKQSREAGFKGTFVGVNAFDSPVVWDGLGAAADGIVFGGVGAHPDSKEAAGRFQAKFKEAFNEEPDWVALYGYSMGQYLLPIVSDANGDPLKIRDALSRLNAETARGHLRMNEHRSIATKGIVFVRKSGKNVPDSL